MKDKLKQLIEMYERYENDYNELAEKGNGYNKGLHQGYADCLCQVISDLEKLLEGDHR